MIEEVNSHPTDFKNWNSSSNSSPYLELYGEAHPFVCTNLTETLPTHSMNDDPLMEAVAPVYEYFWTIGISEELCTQFSHHSETVVDKLKHHNVDPHTGAEVTLYFPLTGGWRVEGVVATIKYVRPLPHQDDLVKKVADYWNTVSPVVSKIADLTEHLSIPGVSTGASLLSILAKTPITSLPPVDGLSWTVKKVTGYTESEMWDGVTWTLPKKLFHVLGSRVTGSIAVYIHPYQQQKQQNTSSNQPIFDPKPILAQAVVYDNGEQVPAKGQEEYIKLAITPNQISRNGEGLKKLIQRFPHQMENHTYTNQNMKGDQS